MPAIDICVNGGAWPPKGDLRKLVRRAVRAAIVTGALRLPKGAELSLVFTDDAGIQGINRQWRGMDKPTNVLSFPGSEVRPGEACSPMMGDIVLARETVAREADLEGKRFEDHLSHLIIHGLFHLFGYDHLDETGAAVMEDLERRTLSTLDIGDPYDAGTISGAA